MEGFFERISAAEKLMAQRIREKLRLIETNYQMIVIELEKYLDLIRMDSMKKELLAERQMVLGHFVNYIKGIKTDFNHKTKMIEQGETVKVVRLLGPWIKTGTPELVWALQYCMVAD